MDKQPTVSDGPEVRQPDGLWEIDDVARYLKLSVPTVRNHMQKRGLPFKRIGARVLFRREEIDHWIEEQQVDSQDDEREAASA